MSQRKERKVKKTCSRSADTKRRGDAWRRPKPNARKGCTKLGARAGKGVYNRQGAGIL